MGLVAAAASVVLIAGIASDRRLPFRRPFTSGLDAHELYVRGRVALDKRTETDIDLARRLFVRQRNVRRSPRQCRPGLR